ncbi:MAG: MBL fold metallo-hydrolase [Alphaproteobacteria bacterium]|nr:MBL fold metallo-hydrolase [Alphaproteobacteria bacterium]
MKITILGCGSAAGVPLIGNKWGECDPSDPRNRRSRASILVEEGDVALLVDTSPDMRQQLLGCDLQRLTAVLYTHAHADHCHGIDDLRSMNWLANGPVPVYADAVTMAELRSRFGYIFDFEPKGNHFSRPFLETHIVEGDLAFGSLRITPFALQHGKGHSLGYRVNDFAYTTDVSEMDEDVFTALDGVKVWIVSCIREKQHPSHADLEKVLGWIERIKPARAILTHMDHSMDYAKLAARLPKGVEPAYDGLVIEC